MNVHAGLKNQSRLAQRQPFVEFQPGFPKARDQRGVEMQIRSFRLALAAMVAAAAMGFTADASQAQNIMRQCGDEWKAAKANNATNGQTWKEFLKDCRTRHAAAAPEAAPAPAAAPAAAPAPAAPAPAPTQAAVPKPTAAPTGAGQFGTAAEAKARCPADTVVWVNTNSRVYHHEGDRSYGRTKKGAYMCEADAKAAGDRASRSRIGAKKTQAAQ